MDSEADIDVVQLLLDDIPFQKPKKGGKDVSLVERVCGFVSDTCVLLLEIKL